jgi:hypothetical protein
MSQLLLHMIIVLAATATGQHQHPHTQDRAQQGMGFDQQKTTHHFLIQTTGGTIEVTARNASDTASVDQIRAHLRHIASAFAQGDFSLPVFVHDTDPTTLPGVTMMKARRAEMTFRYEDIGAGGRVVINTPNTSDIAARDALHEFLRFQIR